MNAHEKNDINRSSFFLILQSKRLKFSLVGSKLYNIRIYKKHIIKKIKRNTLQQKTYPNDIFINLSK